MFWARCSSVVEKSVLVWWVMRSILCGGPIELFLVHNWYKHRLWYVLSCLWDGAYKRSHKRVAHVVAAMGFLSEYLHGPLPYVRRNITLNKMCWMHFLPSFLPVMLNWSNDQAKIITKIASLRNGTIIVTLYIIKHNKKAQKILEKGLLKASTWGGGGLFF